MMTEDGVTGILLAHLGAFGSGELKMKIYSIGFNYSLATSKKFASCLLKMTLEHSSVAYFQVILAPFQWWLYFC